jgi:xanthine dehydrogenase YagS FAD-binding subunit
MRPFSYSRADSAQAAISAQVPGEVPPDTATVHAPNQFLAGDTTLIDLMKLDVMRPRNITDHQRAGPNAVGRHQVWAARPPSRRLGAHVGRRRTRGCGGKLSSDRAVARARSQPADTQHGIAGRQRAAADTLSVLPRHIVRRSNKREPGSGCAALGGFNRSHAVLGTSDHCIATYTGDFAQALIALDTQVELAGPRGSRCIPFANLHRPLGDTPHIETTLERGELILAFMVSQAPWAKRSLYLKIRDRESYEFALASAAVALDLDGDVVRQARIALGGVSALCCVGVSLSTKAKRSPRGPILTPSPASKTAHASTTTARSRRMSHWCMPTAIRPASCVRRLSFPTFTRWKRDRRTGGEARHGPDCASTRQRFHD